MTYTKGPWEVRIWDGGNWPEKRISVGSGNDAVCISPKYRWNIEDFNLIAAAPEMAEYIKSRADAGCERAASLWRKCCGDD